MNTKLINNDLCGRIVLTAILAFGTFCMTFQAGYAQSAIIIANKQITIDADVTIDIISEIKKTRFFNATMKSVASAMGSIPSKKLRH